MTMRSVIVDKEHVGMRLDLFLTRQLLDPSGVGELSRSVIQKMIAGGQVILNGRGTKPATRLKSGDLLDIQWLPPQDTDLDPEPLPLDILYEDGDCIVVNKAPGMLVHPVPGRLRGTLVNALLHHCPNLQGIGGERRPGIVHRLDKDTSGVMVVAKHDRAFHQLAQQFKERRVRKEYLAFVWGLVDRQKGRIDRPIGRHRSDRKRMSSLRSRPRLREALTEWQVENAFRVEHAGERSFWVTLLRLKPHSGRTHQIRVHLADQGYPVVGDRIYGRKRHGLDGNREPLPGVTDFPRQALHAERLGFSHPCTGAPVTFYAPLPLDMQRLLDSLREWHSISERRKVGKGGLTKGLFFFNIRQFRFPGSAILFEISPTLRLSFTVSRPELLIWISNKRIISVLNPCCLEMSRR
ncbi:MAG: RluA family pseudouridine synthase [Deltaproteobacteria bacterium]|nr:RluA family pseudouridine synthase [Deltaproteobacteria bacterium]